MPQTVRAAIGGFCRALNIGALWEIVWQIGGRLGEKMCSGARIGGEPQVGPRRWGSRLNGICTGTRRCRNPASRLPRRSRLPVRGGTQKGTKPFLPVRDRTQTGRPPARRRDRRPARALRQSRASLLNPGAWMRSGRRPRTASRAGDVGTTITVRFGLLLSHPSFATHASPTDDGAPGSPRMRRRSR
jgi:hypothetical protein